MLALPLFLTKYVVLLSLLNKLADYIALAIYDDVHKIHAGWPSRYVNFAYRLVAAEGFVAIHINHLDSGSIDLMKIYKEFIRYRVGVYTRFNLGCCTDDASIIRHRKGVLVR